MNIYFSLLVLFISISNVSAQGHATGFVPPAPEVIGRYKVKSESNIYHFKPGATVGSLEHYETIEEVTAYRINETDIELRYSSQSLKTKETKLANRTRTFKGSNFDPEVILAKYYSCLSNGGKEEIYNSDTVKNLKVCHRVQNGTDEILAMVPGAIVEWTSRDSEGNLRTKITLIDYEFHP
jgi:hypothetical protein